METRRSIGEIRSQLSAAHGSRLRALIDELRDDPRPGVVASIEAALRRERAIRREDARLKRLYAMEDEARASGVRFAAGVDEVGRGALAGPLTAGACILPSTPRIRGLNDSKQLSPARREELAIQIREVAISWSVAHISADEIDSLGMTVALRRVMGRALAGLEIEPDHTFVDGRPIGATRNETAVVKGDAKVAAIAAASIIAKVTRDAMMVEYACAHEAYGFDSNKGYGSEDHMQAIRVHGPCVLHRRSFLPGGGADRLF